MPHPAYSLILKRGCQKHDLTVAYPVARGPNARTTDGGRRLPRRKATPRANGGRGADGVRRARTDSRLVSRDVKPGWRVVKKITPFDADRNISVFKTLD